MFRKVRLQVEFYSQLGITWILHHSPSYPPFLYKDIILTEETHCPLFSRLSRSLLKHERTHDCYMLQTYHGSYKKRAFSLQSQSFA